MSQFFIGLSSSGPIPPTVATQYVANVGTAVPAANILNVLGTTVAAGTIPFQSTGAGNTVTYQLQLSQAIAASNAANVGVAAFNSNQFSVDPNGFVSIIGGAAAIEKVNVQAGTTPIVPTAGAITVNGAVVAAHSIPMQTNGTGTSTFQTEVQVASAIPATNINSTGISAFNSTEFTVDPNGFVSILNFTPFSYIQINAASSPYTVVSTDNYISCDSTAGTITINLPNLPNLYHRYIIKDRTGKAATNNITLTTPGGVVTIDGATSQTLASNFTSLQLLWNGASYEIY